MDTIDFLGFEVNASGIKLGDRKTDATSKFPTPSILHELRQFLGFIKNHALLTSPMTDLLKKDQTWNWGEAQEKSFLNLMTLLTQRSVLALNDSNAVIQLHTDACKDGLAGILLQSDSAGIFHPVSYFSRKTSLDERKQS